jgi:hypothetical protein
MRAPAERKKTRREAAGLKWGGAAVNAAKARWLLCPLPDRQSPAVD